MSTEEYERLNHNIWERKYHIVFILKYRKKAFFGFLRTQIRPILRRMAMHKGCEILESQNKPDHVHMLICIPLKYSVSAIVEYIKGKSAMSIVR